MPSRLPIPGSDTGQWGQILNDYLSVSIDSVGNLKSSAVTSAISAGSISKAQLSSDVQASLDSADAPVVIPDNSVTDAKVASNAAIATSKVAGLDAALATKANDTDVTHNTGTEIIGGTKTFSSSPIVPTPATSNHAANKSYVDDSIITGASRLTTFTLSGNLAVGFGQTKFMFSRPGTIVSIRAVLGTAPTGTSVIIDVNKNGTTLFTNQSNRPTIVATATVSNKITPDVTSLADGDYLTIDIDQIGSSIAGADLCVIVEYL